MISSCQDQEDGEFISDIVNIPSVETQTDIIKLPDDQQRYYTPLGVGGGGAMSGFAISPYANLWLVGTDMGTLFRSTDYGESWNAINHNEAVFSSILPDAVSPGFSSDGKTVFHASQGINPIRSIDGAITFEDISMPLISGEKIKYWQNNTYNENQVLAGTNKGLLISEDKGLNWERISNFNQLSIGTYIDDNKIYHATADKIWLSIDYGKSFSIYLDPENINIRLFTGGTDHKGTTLVFSDDDGENACSWASEYLNGWGQVSIDATFENCGYVWIKKPDSNFSKTNKSVGNHLLMAENDSDTIYTTGAKEWIRQKGTAVHVSHDTGSTWSLKLNQMNWDDNYAQWPESLIEYSAIAVDVGWWDSGYESFAINKRDSSVIGGTGYFFLHTSKNAGDYWKAPFTEYKDTGEITKKKKWITRGIEVISVYKVKFHPTNPELMYAASADIGGIVSDNHGESFRVIKAQYNSNYDYSFDSRDDNIVFAANGNSHDWPESWHANSIKSEGGIYRSIDRGTNWDRLTPPTGDLNRQFLSVAFDSVNNFIYGGSHQTGIVRSVDNGQTWSYLNSGLPSGDKIIPQIEVNPNNGNVYALLTGNAPSFTNNLKTGIYFLDVENGSTNWEHLRGTVNYPAEADSGYKLWYYPTSFAIDFTSNDQDTIWLADYENNRNWLMTGIWKSSDRGQTWDRKLQMTHAVGLTIDPTDTEKVYAAGSFWLNNSWGNGGQYRTEDGGETWIKNMKSPLQANARNATIDPLNSEKVFYTYFGGGILYGEK
jgi:photosystem II stability/assembly factor-like uncharacterized protein